MDHVRSRHRQPFTALRSRASGRRVLRGLAAQPHLAAVDEVDYRRQCFLIARGHRTDRLNHVKKRRISSASHGKVSYPRSPSVVGLNVPDQLWREASSMPTVAKGASTPGHVPTT